jgi:hypothetical protein
MDQKVPDMQGDPDWSQFYTLKENERFPGQSERVVYSFCLCNGIYLPPYTSWEIMMNKIFQHALDCALKGCKPNDMVKVDVEFDDTPLSSYLPMQRRAQLTGDKLFRYVHMIDYYDFISWGSSMKMTVITVTVP